MLKKLTALLILSALTISYSYATHLVGGSIGYEYLGKFGANYRFRITLTTYTDCGPTSQIPAPEDPIQPVGIYEHDVQNDPTAGGNKNFLTNLQLNLISTQTIEPDQPSGCSVGANTCINKGVYEGTVDLPLNFTGYHVVYERCCRNGSIANLIADESMAFYCYISPPLLGNSSPVFTDDPVPFLCVGDTTTILNSAYDPDGDLLTFSFVTPYDGEATNANPAPAPQNPFLVWPIQNVTYAGGYSMAQPFGAGGYNNISGSTGLTTYYPPTVGDYVVAIEIKEFRNGNLIGITRRDLQLLVLNCPNNPAPVIDANLGTTNTVFNVEAGETICFDYGYNDPNGDSVTITSSGAIFDPALTNPAATITSPVSGLDTASTEFCWTTDCNQARTAPYQFQISATDNGCPPNSANNVYEIYVDPVPPPSSITGADVVCQFGTETYTTQAIPATSYNWSVTGGNIVADNGSSVDVEWTTVGAASISLTAENQFGCISEPIDYDVTVTPAPTVEAGNDTTICAGDTIQLTGTTTATPGFTAAWTPNGAIASPTSLSTDIFPTDTTMFYLTVDIGGGCFGIDSVQVGVNNPTVDAGIDTVLCSGDSVQLQGTVGPGTFGWTPIATLSDPAVLDPFADPVSTTNYVLELTDGLGCSNTDTVEVAVSTAFTLTTSNDTTICDGDCANLSASGAVDYVWNTQLTLSDSTIANPIACPPATETYEVIGFDGICSDTAQITVTVGVSPAVDAGLDISICEGDTAQLQATGATIYAWTPTATLSDPAIEDPEAFPTTTTEYFVTGSDALGCTAIDSVTVTVNSNPVADAGEDKGICISVTNGTTAPTEVLDGSGSGGTGVLTPLWDPIGNLSDPNIFTPIFNPPVDTEYVLTVTDVNGCSDTDTVQVTVFGNVPTEAGADTTICPGDTVTIGGNPSADGASTTYLWSPAGLLDDATLANPQAFPTTTTMFYLSTNNDTCNGLDSVLVTVRTPPAVFAGNDVDICINDTTQLSASGAISYVWNEQVTLSDSLIADPLAFPPTTTTYIVEGTDADGCTNTDTIDVNVNPLPIIDAGIDDTICFGDTTQLLATGAITYVWSPTDSLSDPNIDNPMAWPATTTSYIVEGTDANTCVNTDTVEIVVNALPLVDAGANDSICIGETYQLQASGADTYIWTPAVDLDDATIANPVSSASVTTMFYVEGTDANMCVNNDSVEIFVNSLPIVDAGVNVAICIGDTAQLQATGATDYTWSPSTDLSSTTVSDPLAFPTDTIMYYVTGLDGNNCSNIDSVEVAVNPLPTVDAGPDQDICIGASASLLVTGADTYVWSPATSLDDPNIDNPVASPDSTQEYVVIGTDINACVSSDTMIVNVFRISTVPDTSVCAGDSVQLNVFGSVGNTYTWTPIAGLSNPNIANPMAGPSSTTTYYVSVSNIAGCTDQDSVTITIFSAPTASFDMDVEPGCEFAYVDFTNTSIDGVDFFWDFNDGETSDEENPSHQFAYSGSFTVDLTVTNSDGCESTATQSETVLSFDDYYDITLPNVFTPNGDGDNDTYKVIVPGRIYECVDLTIYNRWGQIMFRSSGNNIQWDGHTTVGEACPEGTYMYTLEVNDKQYHGTLMLFK